MELSVSKKVTFHDNVLERTASPRFNLPEEHHDYSYNCIGSSYKKDFSYRNECSKRTPQEMAGIMVNYPGITEYKRRYKWPQGDIKFESIINPGYEGLLEKVSIKKPEYVEQISEYNKRFLWPQ